MSGPFVFRFPGGGGGPFGSPFGRIGQIRLCTLFGIPVYLRPSLLLLLLFFVSGTGSLFTGILYAAMLLAGITAHELAHALVARYFNCPTQDISLSLLGGCASLVRLPRRPYKEFLVAIAGPAMSFVFAAIAWLLMGLLAERGGFSGAASYIWDALSSNSVYYGESKGVIVFAHSKWGGPFFAMRAEVAGLMDALLYTSCTNIWLGLFNLLPGFPMDGGRVFRSVMANFTSRAKATWHAMMVGRAVAVGLGMWGVYRILTGGTWGFVTCLIAYMIWQTGYREYMSVLSEESFDADNWRYARVSPPPYGGSSDEVEVR